MHHKQSVKADKKAGTRPEDQSRHPAGPEGPESSTYATSGHDGTPPRKAHTTPHTYTTFQIYLCFLHFVVSEIPEKTPKRANKI